MRGRYGAGIGAGIPLPGGGLCRVTGSEATIGTVLVDNHAQLHAPAGTAPPAAPDTGSGT